MAKQFKRIYIEITNSCNLSCSFCSKSKRLKTFMSSKNFETIIKEIKPYTDYIYLHVKGEPLLHPELDKFLSICDDNKIKVNITTNGTLLFKTIDILSNHKCLNKINFSLHSENNNPHYCEQIFDSVKELPVSVTIIYRFWTMTNNKLNKISTDIVDKTICYYNLSPKVVDKIRTESNIKIADNIYIDKQEIFEWPNLKNDYVGEEGTCYGLRSHIGILVDGTVIPCCLDGEGVINLGNIFEESLKDILNKDRTRQIKDGFLNRKTKEKLCQHCSYKNRF